MDSWISRTAIIIIAFLVGISIGYYISPLTPAGSLNNLVLIIIPYTTIAGTVIVILKLILDHMKQSVLSYGYIYNRNEHRAIRVRRESGFGYETKEQPEETAYYLRIIKIRGQASLQCEGMIVINDPDVKSNVKNVIVRTVWKGAKYSRFRDISIQDDLKLFHVSHDKKMILFFSHSDDGESQIPNAYFELRGSSHYLIVNQPTNDTQLSSDMLDCVLSVKLGSNNGNVPRKPFEMTIRDIVKTANNE